MNVSVKSKRQLELFNPTFPLSDRFHWFVYNLIRLPVVLVEIPLRCMYNIFHAIYITFFITDGSEHIDLPWS